MSEKLISKIKVIKYVQADGLQKVQIRKKIAKN